MLNLMNFDFSNLALPTLDWYWLTRPLFLDMPEPDACFLSIEIWLFSNEASFIYWMIFDRDFVICQVNDADFIIWLMISFIRWCAPDRAAFYIISTRAAFYAIAIAFTQLTSLTSLATDINGHFATLTPMHNNAYRYRPSTLTVAIFSPDFKRVLVWFYASNDIHFAMISNAAWRL
jgi:hypothetical protein